MEDLDLEEEEDLAVEEDKVMHQSIVENMGHWPLSESLYPFTAW